MKPSTQTTLDLTGQFRELGLRFAQVLGEPSGLEPAGIRILPFRSAEVPHFSKLPESHQQLALSYLQTTISILEGMIAAGLDRHDSPQFVWRALGALGFVPSSSIFDKIDREDIVEIYTPEFRQLFRTLGFFKYVSLTLEELFSVPVTELVEFEAGAQAALLAEGLRFQNSDVTEPFDPGIPPYEWNEKWGERRRGRTQVKWMEPVRGHGGQYVVLVVNRSEML